VTLIPTPELRSQLRELLDEAIQPGSSEVETRFTNMQLDALLVAATHINAAAASGWRFKAVRAMSERGGLQKSSAGDEKHEFVSLEAYRDHCLVMAKMYTAMTAGTGSRLLGYDLL